MDNQELVNCQITLRKFSGKGGWTYAPLPDLPLTGRTHFGMIKVTGCIDAHELEASNLMPLGQGRLFLPVNAAIRKKIGKQAGDSVRLVLYAVAPALHVSAADFAECLAEVPAALRRYEQLAPAEQQAWLRWVSSAPTDNAKVDRMNAALEQLAAGVPASPPA